MNYLSCADAAKAMGITVRRIQQMCKSGEIPGVFKEGRSWLIPENSVLLEEGERKSLCQSVSLILKLQRLITTM